MATTDQILTSNVTLSPEWISLWAGELSADGIFSYLQLASLYELNREFNDGDLTTLFGDEVAHRVENGLAELTEKQLVEVIDYGYQRTLHFPHRNSQGVHEGEACLPSIHAAMAFQKQMNEEIMRLSTQDVSDELRAELFEEYPELKVEYDLYQETKDEDSPRWRLWLELSRLLINQFEQRFGTLRATHSKTFKEASAQVLQHKLSVIDAVTREVFEERDRIFNEVGEDWIVSISDEEFMTHSLVSQLSKRYDVGPAQIYVNTLELLGQSGFVVAEVNASGELIDLLLPTTTGLSKSEQRILFLRPDERASGLDSAVNTERLRRAIEKYGQYLMSRGAALLAEFAAQDRVKSLSNVFEIIAMRVNESLDLVPNCDDEHLVSINDVKLVYEELVNKKDD